MSTAIAKEIGSIDKLADMLTHIHKKKREKEIEGS